MTRTLTMPLIVAIYHIRLIIPTIIHNRPFSARKKSNDNNQMIQPNDNDHERM